MILNKIIAFNYSKSTLKPQLPVISGLQEFDRFSTFMFQNMEKMSLTDIKKYLKSNTIEPIYSDNLILPEYLKFKEKVRPTKQSEINWLRKQFKARTIALKAILEALSSSSKLSNIDAAISGIKSLKDSDSTGDSEIVRKLKAIKERCRTENLEYMKLVSKRTGSVAGSVKSNHTHITMRYVGGASPESRRSDDGASLHSAITTNSGNTLGTEIIRTHLASLDQDLNTNLPVGLDAIKSSGFAQDKKGLASSINTWILEESNKEEASRDLKSFVIDFIKDNLTAKHRDRLVLIRVYAFALAWFGPDAGVPEVKLVSHTEKAHAAFQYYFTQNPAKEFQPISFMARTTSSLTGDCERMKALKMFFEEANHSSSSVSMLLRKPSVIGMPPSRSLFMEMFSSAGSSPREVISEVIDLGDLANGLPVVIQGQISRFNSSGERSIGGDILTDNTDIAKIIHDLFNIRTVEYPTSNFTHILTINDLAKKTSEWLNSENVVQRALGVRMYCYVSDKILPPLDSFQPNELFIIAMQNYYKETKTSYSSLLVQAGRSFPIASISAESHLGKIENGINAFDSYHQDKFAGFAVDPSPTQDSREVAMLFHNIGTGEGFTHPDKGLPLLVSEFINSGNDEQRAIGVRLYPYVRDQVLPPIAFFTDEEIAIIGMQSSYKTRQISFNITIGLDMAGLIRDTKRSLKERAASATVGNLANGYNALDTYTQAIFGQFKPGITMTGGDHGDAQVPVVNISTITQDHDYLPKLFHEMAAGEGVWSLPRGGELSQMVQGFLHSADDNQKAVGVRLYAYVKETPALDRAEFTEQEKAIISMQNFYKDNDAVYGSAGEHPAIQDLIHAVFPPPPPSLLHNCSENGDNSPVNAAERPKSDYQKVLGSRGLGKMFGRLKPNDSL